MISSSTKAPLLPSLSNQLEKSRIPVPRGSKVLQFRNFSTTIFNSLSMIVISSSFLDDFRNPWTRASTYGGHAFPGSFGTPVEWRHRTRRSSSMFVEVGPNVSDESEIENKGDGQRRRGPVPRGVTRRGTVGGRRNASRFPG